MLIPVPSNQIARAGEVLGRAFRDDPLWKMVISDPDRHADLLTAMFTAVTRATVAARGVAQTTPDIDAVALWLPPGRNLGFGSMVRSGFALPRFVRMLLPGDRKRMMAVLGQLEKGRKALMPEPHWYLSALGVDPNRQGEGLGSTLLGAGVRRADRDGVPIYLETEVEENVRFYEGHGFEVIEQIDATGINIPIWILVRRA
jgi:ribosomal protein S18 acetylase RimI-like enzyme